MHSKLVYKAPRWLPGGQAQTIWPALFSRRHWGARPTYRRERWDTPDGDFIDVDFAISPTTQEAPLLVLFHGLEGSSRSHYAEAFADWAAQHQVKYAVPHFRGCSGEINRAPRAYHSGDFEEIGWMLDKMHTQHPQTRIIAVGISLGGNALLRWAQEMGAMATQHVCAISSVCSPIDLTASGHAIGRGFNRQVYTRMFLRTMKPKALERLALHPGLFDRQKLQASQDLYEFDNVFTAPVHGFKNTDDYWSRASAKPHLHRINIPALVVNTQNDGFVPASSLPQQHEVGPHVTLWKPRHGGHVGFASGALPGHVRALPDAVGAWLLEHV
jgi:uncharacterized protein